MTNEEIKEKFGYERDSIKDEGVALELLSRLGSDASICISSENKAKFFKKWEANIK